MLIGYVTLGTNDLTRSGQFYDELLALLGAHRTMTDERMLGWGNTPDATMFSVILPYDQEPASVGNGVMVALAAQDAKTVEAVYAKALSLGASDEGHPHDRGSTMGFYGGYFRDLDGNKLVVYCLQHYPS